MHVLKCIYLLTNFIVLYSRSWYDGVALRNELLFPYIFLGLAEFIIDILTCYLKPDRGVKPDKP